MKSTFLKLGLSLTMILTMAVFYSCKKDKDSSSNGNNDDSAFKITAANVVNSPAQVAVVKALAYWGDDSSGGCDTIAQAPYSINGFTLELPATLPDKYFVGGITEIEDGITISDKNAKIFYLNGIRGYDEDEHEIGYFYLGYLEESDNYYAEYKTLWAYADRDVTKKGEIRRIDYYYNYEEILKYDLKLKKGWNIVYDSRTNYFDYSTNRMTDMSVRSSQKPFRINYLWHFYGYEYNYKSAGLQNPL